MNRVCARVASICKGSSMDDWRLNNQEEYLLNRILRRRTWFSNKADWDHDHCEFCMKKISKQGDDENEAYVTTGDGYHWICNSCFEDFRFRFKWTVEI